MHSSVGIFAVLAIAVASSTIIQPANYRVYLDNCGPRSRALPVITAPSVITTPVQSRPVTLPYVVPRPRTVSNSCRCVKTIVKPQVVQQVINVPVIKKYVQTLAKPTYEVINYTAEPINCPRFESYACLGNV